MPPHPKTSKEEILKVAAQLADAEGLRGVGVRAIATRLGISPGTIYNVVGDIDELMLRVNEQTLIGLSGALRKVIAPARTPLENLLVMADAYIDFVAGHSRRWSMVIEYSHAADKPLPAWYDRRIEEAVGTVDSVLRPMIPRARERQRVVAVLWAALEGFASLTASGKLSHVVGDDPHALVRLLLQRFLGTFQQDSTAAADDAVSRPRGRRSAGRS